MDEIKSCPFCGNEDTKVILASPYWMLNMEKEIIAAETINK